MLSSYKRFLEAVNEPMVICDAFDVIVAYNQSGLQQLHECEPDPLNKEITPLLHRLEIKVKKSDLDGGYLLYTFINSSMTERIKHVTEVNIELLENLINSTIGGYLIFHEDVIQDVNEAAIKIFDYKNKEEMIGLHRSNFTTEMMPKVDEIFEMVFLNKFREKIDVFVKERVVEYEGMELRVLSVVDITVLINREKLRAKKIRYEQRSQMIDMIAHQWRQPLGAVAGSLATLQFDNMMNRYNKEKFDTQLGDATNKLQRLSELIDDFRGFFHEDKFPVKDYIFNTVAKAMELQDAYSEPTLKIELDGDNVEINTFHNELVHVFSNLIKNSSEAAKNREINQPHIKITIKLQENNLSIEFRDNCGGMDSETMEKAFDPYFTTKSELNGTGLGLYICNVIIKEHCKGGIDLASYDDQTVFNIYIKGM